MNLLVLDSTGCNHIGHSVFWVQGGLKGYQQQQCMQILSELSLVVCWLKIWWKCILNNSAKEGCSFHSSCHDWQNRAVGIAASGDSASAFNFALVIWVWCDLVAINPFWGYHTHWLVVKTSFSSENLKRAKDDELNQTVIPRNCYRYAQDILNIISQLIYIEMFSHIFNTGTVKSESDRWI